MRSEHFFTEVILVTIFSLVSSALWIELIKHVISKYFHNDETILLLLAIILTVTSIIFLKYFFKTNPKDENKKY